MRMRTMLSMSTLAAALCTATTLAGGSNCCVPNGGLGCDDPTCQAAVCGLDTFCCTTQWDAICASEAASLCADLCNGGGGGVCGTGGDCCTASGGLGCNDVTCCETVCAIDSFCCAVAWDTICASEAASLCADLCGGGGGCGTGGDCCTASGGLGCNDVTCCETVCAVDSFCCAVAWDGICASEAASICSDLCGGSVCLGDFDSNGVVDAADLAVLLGGWNGAGSTDLDGNGTTDAADLALLLGAWGACP